MAPTALVSLLLLLPLALAQLPPPIPIRDLTCQVGGFAPSRPCASGTCVLTSFGNPAVDLPRSGICRSLPRPPPACTVALCSRRGGGAVCAVTTPTRLVATCRAWAARTDVGGVGPDCSFACTEECMTPRLVASDGSEYCNLCKLQAASCRARFAFFGPVRAPDACRMRPIPPFEAGRCCAERGIGCLGNGRRCSTLGSRIRPVPCKTGLTCVIRDFGFPAADGPNSGRCRRVRNVRKCSVGRCTRFGPRHVCEVPLPRGSGIVSTCRAWARRSDGNPGPDCSFACILICAVGDARPLASNGKRFCSICQLRQKSCTTGFRVFGPVSP